MRANTVSFFNDWMNAVCKAYGNVLEHPENPRTETVNFEIGPPDDGRMSIAVKSGGRTVLSFPVYDSHLPFKNASRWMERSCDFLSNGEKVPESVGINCIDYNIIMTVVHTGFREFRHGGETLHGPVSFFMIYRSGSREMAYTCYCSTDELLSNLHSSVIDAFCRFKFMFNDRKRWSMTADFSGRCAPSPAERLVRDMFSLKIARILHH